MCSVQFFLGVSCYSIFSRNAWLHKVKQTYVAVMDDAENGHAIHCYAVCVASRNWPKCQGIVNKRSCWRKTV